MKNLNLIAEELFNKIRGRFPSVTLGDAEGKVTNIPTDARFFDFDYKEGATNLGKVSVSLTDSSVEIMYSDNFVSEQDELTKENWYNFLKEIRQFSKKRLMTFDTRNINKSNLDKRDYKFLAQNRGEETMSESKMYGTSRVSYQKVDGARLVVKHTESVNQELAGGRTRSIGKIYIESADGERFMYPFKHLSGARAMARHVAEGGKPFDEFGTHIVGLSEEMNKLRKFKSYMGRSAVMAESLAGYSDAVNDRIKLVKRTIESLQKPKFYAETFKAFAPAVMEDVPADVKENWIDQLTIKQFNEELSDVFPYIYKLVGEATKATQLSAEDLLGENDDTDDAVAAALGMGTRPKARPDDLGDTRPAESYVVKPGDTIWSIADRFSDSNYMGDTKEGAKDILELNGITDPKSLQPGQKLEIGYFMGTGPSGGSRGMPPGGFKNYESQLEDSFEEMMGQFAEDSKRWKQTSMDPKDAIAKFGKDNVKVKKGGLNNGDDMIEIFVEDNTDESIESKLKEGAEEQKIPISEFILSLFDRETGKFPKGETAVLTAIEKDYGEQYINPGKAFIEAITAKFEQFKDPDFEQIEPQMEAVSDQEAIESWYDEVVSAITSRNITFPIAEPKIQKVADVVADDWGDKGPSEDVVLSIINGENDQTTQDSGEEIFLDFSKELTDVERTDDTEEFTAKLSGLGFRAGSEEEIDLEGIPVNVTINATGYVQEGEFEIVSVTGDDGTQYVLDETDTWDIYNLTELFSNALATEDTNMYASQNNTVMEPTIQQDEELGDIRRLAGI